MNDFSSSGFDGGTVGTPSEAPATLPDQQQTPPQSQDERMDLGRSIVLGQLAKSEDVSEYAAEREDEAAVIDRGEEIGQARQNRFFRRASKALNDAVNEATGIQPNGQQPQYDPAAYQEQADQTLDYMRKQGAAAERINQYYGNDTERRQEVVNWGAAMDPEHHVANWLIDNESRVAPQILERLTASPEAWRELAELPPQTRNRWLSKFEGYVEAELKFGKQQAQQQQAAQAVRRTTQAPPIIPCTTGRRHPAARRDGSRLSRRGRNLVRQSAPAARTQREIKETDMATITVVFTDNSDRTATVTSTFATAQTVTSDSVGKLIDVAKGWVQQSIPLLVFN
jgi:hypothetical protein